MSIETKAILFGHLAASTIIDILRNDCGVKLASVRAMRSPDHKMVEMVGSAGNEVALDLFLNSWAVDDHASVYVGASTFAVMEFSPTNAALLAGLTAVTGGFVQRVSGEEWVALNVRAEARAS